MAEKKKAANKKTVSTKNTSGNGTTKTMTDTPRKSVPTPTMKIKKSYVIAVIAVLVIAGLLYFFRTWLVVAMVNGQPISRLSYMNELERQAGKQTMNSLVTKTLILQEAKKQNVAVSDTEVNNEIKTIEDNLKQQGQQLDQVLTLQGMTREQLVEQIRLQKSIEKMVGKNVKISDKEVDDYIAANRESMPQATDEASLKKTARQSMQQQKLNSEVQKWLENLQKNAKITYFVTI